MNLADSVVPAYIGLGSNPDQPVSQLRRALKELDDVHHSRLAATSGLYRSAPMGPAGQPDYVNAVALLETRLAPLALLDALQAIEQRHGRLRRQRWGPRTLDLDLLLYGDAVIASSRLTVPHPGLHERSFVLTPLAEIAPKLRVPGHGSVAALAKARTNDRVERIQDSGSGADQSR